MRRQFGEENASHFTAALFCMQGRHISENEVFFIATFLEMSLIDKNVPFDCVFNDCVSVYTNKLYLEKIIFRQPLHFAEGNI
jgi:hypothetical protein